MKHVNEYRGHLEVLSKGVFDYLQTGKKPDWRWLPQPLGPCRNTLLEAFEFSIEWLATSKGLTEVKTNYLDRCHTTLRHMVDEVCKALLMDVVTTTGGDYLDASVIDKLTKGYVAGYFTKLVLSKRSLLSTRVEDSELNFGWKTSLVNKTQGSNDFEKTCDSMSMSSAVLSYANVSRVMVNKSIRGLYDDGAITGGLLLADGSFSRGKDIDSTPIPTEGKSKMEYNYEGSDRDLVTSTGDEQFDDGLTTLSEAIEAEDLSIEETNELFTYNVDDLTDPSFKTEESKIEVDITKLTPSVAARVIEDQAKLEKGWNKQAMAKRTNIGLGLNVKIKSEVALAEQENMARIDAIIAEANEEDSPVPNKQSYNLESLLSYGGDGVECPTAAKAERAELQWGEWDDMNPEPLVRGDVNSTLPNTYVDHGHPPQEAILNSNMKKQDTHMNYQMPQSNAQQYHNNVHSPVAERTAIRPPFNPGLVNDKNPTIKYGSQGIELEESGKWNLLAEANNLTPQRSVFRDKSMPNSPMVAWMNPADGILLPIVVTSNTASRFTFVKRDVHANIILDSRGRPILCYGTETGFCSEMVPHGRDDLTIFNVEESMEILRHIGPNDASLHTFAMSKFNQGIGGSQNGPTPASPNVSQHGSGYGHSATNLNASLDTGSLYNTAPSHGTGAPSSEFGNNTYLNSLTYPDTPPVYSETPNIKQPLPPIEDTYNLANRDYQPSTQGRIKILPRETAARVEKEAFLIKADIAARSNHTRAKDIVPCLIPGEGDGRGTILYTALPETCFFQPNSIELISATVSYDMDLKLAVNVWHDNSYVQILVDREKYLSFYDALQEDRGILTDKDGNEMALTLDPGEGFAHQLLEETPMPTREEEITIDETTRSGSKDIIIATVSELSKTAETVLAIPTIIETVLPANMPKSLLVDLELIAFEDHTARRLCAIIKYCSEKGDLHAASKLNDMATDYVNGFLIKSLGIKGEDLSQISSFCLGDNDYPEMVKLFKQLGERDNVDYVGKMNSRINADLGERMEFAISSLDIPVSVDEEDEEEGYANASGATVARNVLTHSLAQYIISIEALEAGVTNGEILNTQQEVLFNLVNATFLKLDSTGTSNAPIMSILVMTGTGQLIRVFRSGETSFARYFAVEMK